MAVPLPDVPHQLIAFPLPALLDEPSVAVDLTGRPAPALARPLPRQAHGPAVVVALCNQKGGVGKTTSTINLGAALAESGRRVLVVDMDPQGSLSIGLGLRDMSAHLTMYQVLMSEDPEAARAAIVPTPAPDMDMLPSDIRLSAAELRLAGSMSREYALDRALTCLRPDYDYILIDCQPSLGLLTINALTAADTVVVPTECEFLALRGVSMLLDTVAKVKERLNPRLRLCGILPTMVDTRSTHSRDTMAAVVDLFGDLVFHSAIARAVRFPESTKAGVPVVVAEPTCAGAISYRHLAWELAARVEGAV